MGSFKMGSFPFLNGKLPILKPNIDRPCTQQICVVNKQINIHVRDVIKIIVDIDIVTNDIVTKFMLCISKI